MKIEAKWRPSLALVVACVLGVVLCLPLASFLYFNFYGKQLVQQTEEALIGQAAVLAASFATEFEASGADPRLGKAVPKDARPDPDKLYAPIFPKLTLNFNAIKPRRADPEPAARPPLPVYRDIGAALSKVSVSAQLTTLAGFRVIDPFGRVIGGSGEVGYGLAHIPEVRRALAGYPTTLLRRRVSDEPDPPIWSISRRTDFRVFVALPVVVEAHVVGAVYLSRTPGNIVQAMYLERANLAFAALSIIGVAGLIGFMFLRFITRPIYGLIEQTRMASEPEPPALSPLSHYGTREVAKLGQSFLNMTGTLNARTASIQTFTNHVTHELKSPLTSILGATELLADDHANLSDDAKARFIANMAGDAERMTRLLDRLAQLASAKESAKQLGAASFCDPQISIDEMTARFPALRIKSELDGTDMPASQQNVTMILTHLIENSAQHGASEVTVAWANRKLVVVDNGSGISRHNIDRIFDPFFTTRRDAGGTGMGLGIVEALVSACKGEIRYEQGDKGARFVVSFL